MKKTKIKLTIIFDYEVADHFDDELIQFTLEENHCVANIISFLNEKVEADSNKGVCSICSYSEVKVLPI